MTILTLVRHGETDWNAQRRIQGSTDIPLNDTGRAQARAAAEVLRTRLDLTAPVEIASSDLSRANETARIIAAELGLGDVAVHPDLRERAYGDAEGVTDTEFFDRWGPWRTAEVPGAEAWSDVRTRALVGLRAAIRTARLATAPEAPTLVIVSHGALIREVIRHATGGAFPLDTEKLANGSAHTFRYERDRLQLLEYTAATP